jgi:AraC-like DNA-binding protein
VFPQATTDLKINFGDAILGLYPDSAQPFVTCTQSWCTGPASEQHIVGWAVNTHYIGIAFKTGGAYPFLRLPLTELHGQIVPLDTLWGRFAEELRERLYDAKTTQARFLLLEQLLLARLRDPPANIKTVRAALTRLSASDHPSSVRELSQALGLSQKHLITLFKQLVGTSPKGFARLARFQHILEHIRLATPVRWTELAYAFGYTDQSHFNKDFSGFTGHTPTQYLALRRRVLNETPAHAEHIRVLPFGSLP